MNVRRRRTAPIAGRTFPYRRRPRDRYDWRLSIAVTLLSLLAAIILPALLFATFFALVFVLEKLGVPDVVCLLMFALLLLIVQLGVIPACFAPLIWSLTVADDGLHIRGVTGAKTIRWDEVEAVEPLGRGEALAAMLRYPFRDRKLKSSGGMTFGGYVRIRHKNGVLLYAPESRAELLDALHTHLHHQNPKVEIPVWQFHEVLAQPTTADTEQVQRLGRG